MGKFSGIVDERGAMTCFSVSRLVRRHGREGAENGEGRKGLLGMVLLGGVLWPVASTVYTYYNLGGKCGSDLMRRGCLGFVVVCLGGVGRAKMDLF